MELSDLNGLNGLEEVGSSFQISSNISLMNLDGLESLTTVNQNLSIGLNPELQNIDALSNLTSVGGDVSIGSNTNLMNLCGIRPLLVNNGRSEYLSIDYNGFNPTGQQIIDGNCSQ